jgi:hypothetical protein
MKTSIGIEGEKKPPGEPCGLRSGLRDLFQVPAIRAGRPRADFYPIINKRGRKSQGAALRFLNVKMPWFLTFGFFSSKLEK